jgi:hypothetical protein
VTCQRAEAGAEHGGDTAQDRARAEAERDGVLAHAGAIVAAARVARVRQEDPDGETDDEPGEAGTDGAVAGAAQLVVPAERRHLVARDEQRLAARRFDDESLGNDARDSIADLRRARSRRGAHVNEDVAVGGDAVDLGAHGEIVDPAERVRGRAADQQGGGSEQRERSRSIATRMSRLRKVFHRFAPMFARSRPGRGLGAFFAWCSKQATEPIGTS